MKLLIQQLNFVKNHSESSFILVHIEKTEGSSYKKKGAFKIVALDGSCAGLISGGCLESDINSAALAMKTDSKTQVFNTLGESDRLFGTATGCQGKLHLTFQKIQKNYLLQKLEERLKALNLDVHVVGAGPDLDPLKGLLEITGWTYRFYTSDSQALEQRRQQGWPIHLVTQPKMDWVISNPERTAVLLMSHNYPLDLDIFRQLSQFHVGYIGILGPEQRRLQMLQDLNSMYQIPETDFESTLVEGPMGIRGLGKGELAIALSICSRLQQLFFGNSR